MIINYYKSKGDAVTSPIDISRKTAVLVLLSTGKCPSEVCLMDLSSYEVSEDKIEFFLQGHTKTARRYHPEDRLITVCKCKKLPPYMCPYSTLTSYIQRSAAWRTSTKLFVTSTKGTAISAATLARWTKEIMTRARIDTTFFTPYSMHSAATSSAAKCTSSLSLVLQMGNWHSTSTFYKFYLRKVKYFNRKKTKKSKPKETVENDSCHIWLVAHAPAPLPNVHLAYSLQAALSRHKKALVKLPYIDAPGTSFAQGLTDPLTDEGNYLDVSDCPSTTESCASSCTEMPKPTLQGPAKTPCRNVLPPPPRVRVLPPPP